MGSKCNLFASTSLLSGNSQSLVKDSPKPRTFVNVTTITKKKKVFVIKRIGYHPNRILKIILAFVEIEM